MANEQQIGNSFFAGENINEGTSPASAGNGAAVGQNFFERINPTLQRVEELANTVAAGFARDPDERHRRSKCQWRQCAIYVFMEYNPVAEYSQCHRIKCRHLYCNSD